MNTIILDGPIGTELTKRGIATPAPRWSAEALVSAPHIVSEIHREHVQAGAHVVTANTFRTTQRAWGRGWRQQALSAVSLATTACHPHTRVAGSIAPLEDCYSPHLSPRNPRAEHLLLAETLAEGGCDLLLCETFAHPDEALAAVDAAMSTGLPVWLALTAGPNADLMTPTQMHDVAREAVHIGAEAVLVNCVPASQTLPFLTAIADCAPRYGAYANAGAASEALGWSDEAGAGERYLSFARQWHAAGASIIGSCCGVSLSATRRLAEAFAAAPNTRS